MTVLALRMASASNGVSKLHGKVSRGMWKAIWPGVPENEIPIGHVTNGVHFRSWISCEMNQLYDRYLGPKWREEHADSNLVAARGEYSGRGTVAHPRAAQGAAGGVCPAPPARCSSCVAAQPNRKSTPPTKCSTPMP